MSTKKGLLPILIAIFIILSTLPLYASGYIVSLLGTAVFAMFSWHVIEGPAQRFKKTLLAFDKRAPLPWTAHRPSTGARPGWAARLIPGFAPASRPAEDR